MRDVNGLMKQAQGMQLKLQKAQAEIAELEVEGSSGSGLATVTLKGSGEMTALRIDPGVFAEGDAETLGDLVLAAHADARRALEARSRALMEAAMGPLAGLAGMAGLKP